VLTGWRVAYVVALLGLTVVTEAWLADRGGANGDYGVIYAIREAQARAVAAAATAAVHRRLPPRRSEPDRSRRARVSFDSRRRELDLNWMDQTHREGRRR